MPAEVKPWVEAPIYARANGYLKRWTADLGATVEAGQLLAEIEARDMQDTNRTVAPLRQGEANSVEKMKASQLQNIFLNQNARNFFQNQVLPNRLR